jgi:hypothetical protein
MAWGAASRSDTCFYCGLDTVCRVTEEDHFPIPDRCGGTNVVTACVACHDLKDRSRMTEWFTKDRMLLLENKLNAAPKREAFALMFFMGLAVGDVADIEDEEEGDEWRLLENIPELWDSLDGYERVVVARFLMVFHDKRKLFRVAA